MKEPLEEDVSISLRSVIVTIVVIAIALLLIYIVLAEVGPAVGNTFSSVGGTL